MGLGVLLLVACRPIDVGLLAGPPGLGIEAIEDGALPGGSGRALTLGDTVRVTVRAANRGRVALSSPVTRLTFRRGAGGAAEPVEAVVRAVGTPPAALAVDATADFVFEVTAPATAQPGTWVVGAEVQAAGSGATPAPAALERRWELQRPPRVEARAVTVVSGNSELASVSVNPGCSAVLAVELRNDGEAGLEVTSVVLQPVGRATPSGLGVTLVEVQPNATLAGQATAVAHVRLDGDEALTAPARFTARFEVQGTDVNNGTVVVSEVGRGVTFELTVSPARLVLSGLTAPGSARAGDTNLSFGVSARYDPGRPGMGQPLESLGARVLVPAAGASWPAGVSSPASLMPCPPPPAPCAGTAVALAVEVPTGIPPGLARLGLMVTGRETEMGQGQPLTVGVCGVVPPPLGVSLDVLP